MTMVIWLSGTSGETDITITLIDFLYLKIISNLHRTGKKNNLVSEHAKSINDMQLSKDGGFLITASKDCTAKLFNAETLECLKTYKTERPVNSAAISPIMDHVNIIQLNLFLYN